MWSRRARAVRRSERRADDLDAHARRIGGSAPFSPLQTREHQMFPILTEGEIERMSRFGAPARYRAGDWMFRTGETGRGMVIVLKGTVRVICRDALGNGHVVREHGPGNFLAEVAQLSGKPCLVDGMVVDDLEGIVVPPDRLHALLVAEAELGECIMRALILQRVGLIEKGSDPVLLGQSDDGRFVSLQGFAPQRLSAYGDRRLR